MVYLLPSYLSFFPLPPTEMKKPLVFGREAFSFQSGWQDSNLRPPAPKAGAIPGYATPRRGAQKYSFIFFITNAS